MILKDYSGAKRFKRFKSIKITASPIIHQKMNLKEKNLKKKRPISRSLHTEKLNLRL